jgi:hypothetical protein
MFVRTLNPSIALLFLLLYQTRQPISSFNLPCLEASLRQGQTNLVNQNFTSSYSKTCRNFFLLFRKKPLVLQRSQPDLTTHRTGLGLGIRNAGIAIALRSEHK